MVFWLNGRKKKEREKIQRKCTGMQEGNKYEQKQYKQRPFGGNTTKRGKKKRKKWEDRKDRGSKVD
jgi:hypothetical protein